MSTPLRRTRGRENGTPEKLEVRLFPGTSDWAVDPKRITHEEEASDREIKLFVRREVCPERCPQSTDHKNIGDKIEGLMPGELPKRELLQQTYRFREELPLVSLAVARHARPIVF